jgi:hypothetical protein
MRTSPHLGPIAERFAESLRIACAGCGHSEFIHGDRNARSCLYSECRCRSFTAPDPAEVGPRARKGPRARSAAAFAHR